MNDRLTIAMHLLAATRHSVVTAEDAVLALAGADALLLAAGATYRPQPGPDLACVCGHPRVQHAEGGTAPCLDKQCTCDVYTEA